MAAVTLATTQRDAAAAEAVEQHHAELAGSLATHVQRVVATAHDDSAAATARDGLLARLHGQLLPHARAEEDTLYAAAGNLADIAVLVRAMIDEHETLVGLVGELEHASDPVRAAGLAIALDRLFNVHLSKENDYLLPGLAGSSDHDLADLLGGLHELVGDHGHGREHHAADPDTDHHDHGHHDDGGGHDCGCGEVDADQVTELDVRAIPHAIRHATVFGALDAVGPNQAVDLVVHHDPVPLLAQLQQASPGRFTVDYLERGPEVWRLRFTATG